MRHASFPLVVLASCLGGATAGESPIADLRFGAELGIGIDTEFTLSNHSPTTDTVVRTAIDDQPRRFSLGYVRGLGESASSGPIVGVHAFYARGGGKFQDTAASSLIGGSRVDTTTLGLDLELGYAAVLPSAPGIHVEGTVFAGLIMQEHRLSLGSTGTLGFGGDGFESGARLSAVRTFANRWQLAATVRYLFESEVEANFGDSGSSDLTSDGVLVGLALGYRL
ncbi:MAG: hypothetical protein H0X45_03140 [Planctomycetes bacterium]|nr:hypothetical protein [Planctomycetota bacterium]